MGKESRENEGRGRKGERQQNLKAPPGVVSCPERSGNGLPG
nr:MAG TPA: hypothetical protein [Caudoviricetes sp.]DAU66177.1 MAG TPA: hypothetical protein [Caudoviricetes sp.]